VSLPLAVRFLLLLEKFVVDFSDFDFKVVSSLAVRLIVLVLELLIHFSQLVDQMSASLGVKLLLLALNAIKFLLKLAVEISDLFLSFSQIDVLDVFHL